MLRLERYTRMCYEQWHGDKRHIDNLPDKDQTRLSQRYIKQQKKKEQEMLTQGLPQ